MPQDIKIWEISKKDKLRKISKSKLDLEERLENWLEEDISIISNDLLVIGRQVSTDLGGMIDLLAVDSIGDVVIIELKRDKTPRDITAQVLDYASWVENLSNEKITEIADKYLAKENSLEKAFKEKFDTEFPEVINENHKILIVASKIDRQSERIIEYLSDRYGVGINAVTFQSFKDEEKEYLSRVFLIDPSEAEDRTKTRATSKRKPNLTFEQLENTAKENEIFDIYEYLVENLEKYFDQRATTGSSIVFIGLMGKNESRNTILSILPGESNSEKGLQYKVYMDRFKDYFNLDKKKAINIFPDYTESRTTDWAGEEGEGCFKNKSQVKEFLQKLKEVAKK